MRATLALCFVALALAACGGGEDKTVVVPQSQPAVVVPQSPPAIVAPQGASVVCPNGSSAVMVNGVYRC
ncbi:MAG TPA: hypothetical protein VE397_19510 [Stellaceae bacterium]|jgi:hypothetical protein|nr:hypothetical protein [Stellaceae bacterium]